MRALGDVYKQKVAISGPLPAGHDITSGQVIVRFKHTDGGLVAKGGELKGFVIAGNTPDGKQVWFPAQARIEGDTVVVSHPKVSQPVAVRYAWQDNPDCNLFNGAGLPASPFRTDVP
jgi:sialate O-acetylesterase